MTDTTIKRNILANILALKKDGYDVVLVHGGGPFIKEMLDKVGLQSTFIDGQRYTSPKAFTYIEMVLKGKVNSDLVNTINSMGFSAVGLSGKDGNTVIAHQRKHQENVELGLVGDVSRINPELINHLLDNDFIPVLACIGSDENGIGFNINGDTFAGYLAGALHAKQFIILTDVDGLLKDKDDPSSIIREIAVDQLKSLKEDGTIQGGMIPKIEACETAIDKGANTAKIINGTKPEQVAQINSDTVGTLITN